MSVEKGFQWGALATQPRPCSGTSRPCTSCSVVRRSAPGPPAHSRHCLALNGQGFLLAWRGDFAAATALAGEADALTDATGTHVAPYGAPMLTGLRGDERHAWSIEAARNARSRTVWQSRSAMGERHPVERPGSIRQALSARQASEAPRQYRPLGAPGADRGGGADRVTTRSPPTLSSSSSTTNANDGDWARGIWRGAKR